MRLNGQRKNQRSREKGRRPKDKILYERLIDFLGYAF